MGTLGAELDARQLAGEAWVPAGLLATVHSTIFDRIDGQNWVRDRCGGGSGDDRLMHGNLKDLALYMEGVHGDTYRQKGCPE